MNDIFSAKEENTLFNKTNVLAGFQIPWFHERPLSMCRPSLQRILSWSSMWRIGATKVHSGHVSSIKPTRFLRITASGSAVKQQSWQLRNTVGIADRKPCHQPTTACRRQHGLQRWRRHLYCTGIRVSSFSSCRANSKSHIKSFFKATSTNAWAALDLRFWAEDRGHWSRMKALRTLKTHWTRTSPWGTPWRPAKATTARSTVERGDSPSQPLWSTKTATEFWTSTSEKRQTWRTSRPRRRSFRSSLQTTSNSICQPLQRLWKSRKVPKRSSSTPTLPPRRRCASTPRPSSEPQLLSSWFLSSPSSPSSSCGSE